MYIKVKGAKKIIVFFEMPLTFFRKYDNIKVSENIN